MEDTERRSEHVSTVSCLLEVAPEMLQIERRCPIRYFCPRQRRAPPQEQLHAVQSCSLPEPASFIGGSWPHSRWSTRVEAQKSRSWKVQRERLRPSRGLVLQRPLHQQLWAIGQPDGRERLGGAAWNRRRYLPARLSGDVHARRTVSSFHGQHVTRFQ